MVRTSKRILLILLFGVIAGIGGLSSATAAPRAEHVFIISFDQGNPDLIQRTEMPTFHSMAQQGARTWEAYTTIPPLTLPSHTSMLTGVGVQKHQVTWNDYDPKKEPLKVPTIFSLARERGLKTAMFVGKEKLKHLELPGSLDALVWPKTGDDARSVAASLSDQIEILKPNLCFIHFRDPDTVGHKHGAYSQEKVQALKDCDAALKTIQDAVTRAGMIGSSVFILTADHGGHDVKNKLGKTVGVHDTTQPSDVTIPWVAWGRGVKKNFTITSPVIQYDTAATALWLLDVPLPENFWGRPVISAFE